MAVPKDSVPTRMSIGGKPKKQKALEVAGEGDSLMGRLAMRMASRDMIDELDLGPRGRSPEVKKAQVADMSTVPSKLMVGAGEHQQTLDLKAFNMSDPIPTSKVREGSNMADQAKAAGNVWVSKP